MAPRWTQDSGWVDDDPAEFDPDSGIKAFRGALIACAVTAVIVLAGLAVLWFAL